MKSAHTLKSLIMASISIMWKSCVQNSFKYNFFRTYLDNLFHRVIARISQRVLSVRMCVVLSKWSVRVGNSQNSEDYHEYF